MRPTHTVYLLHFTMPDGTVRHYVGLTTPGRLPKRLSEHAAGTGSRFTRAMLEAGGAFVVSRQWGTHDPRLERTIKNGGHYRRRCPLCSPLQHVPTPDPLTPHAATFPLHPDVAQHSISW